jgi:hypothetical protein
MNTEIFLAFIKYKAYRMKHWPDQPVPKFRMFRYAMLRNPSILELWVKE